MAHVWVEHTAHKKDAARAGIIPLCTRCMAVLDGGKWLSANPLVWVERPS